MNTLWTALRFFIFLTLVTGIIYPLIITGIAKIVAPEKSNGSFVKSKNKIVGSALIAQSFTSDKYFWPRPSAVEYNPLPSGGSNLGPTSAKLVKAVDERVNTLKTMGAEIPAELLFASGSGLDPHISPETAYFQAERVAKARGMKKSDVEALIEKNRESSVILGYPTINVLLLNIELDKSKEL